MPLLMLPAVLRPRGAVRQKAARDLQCPAGIEDMPIYIPAGARPGIFPACANPRCGSGWLHLWRSRETPVFESGWCCSPACAATRVEAAVAREMDARGNSVQGHRHRIPLGLAMLEQGWITQKDLRAALAAQRAAGSGRLG